jgi:type III secretion protein F
MAGSTTNNGSADFVPTLPAGTDHNGNITANGFTYTYLNKDGFDLVWNQQQLQTQMGKIEDDIRNIQQNANLSDTEKAFSMQMAMNTWSTIANLRTNTLKAVSDVLKTCARNIE